MKEKATQKSQSPSCVIEYYRSSRISQDLPQIVTINLGFGGRKLALSNVEYVVILRRSISFHLEILTMQFGLYVEAPVHVRVYYTYHFLECYMKGPQ